VPLSRITLTFFLAFVIAFSFLAFIQKETNQPLSSGRVSNIWGSNAYGLTSYNLLAYPAVAHGAPVFSPLLSGVVLIEDGQISLLENATRTEIYDFITANPGVQFRGICTGLGLAIGTAEFHLGILTKAGIVSFIRDGRYKRFFASKKFSLREMKTIGLLRQKTAGTILTNLLHKKIVSRLELASQLSITSQGLTWQMNRLTKSGVVTESRDGLRVFYSIENSQTAVLRQVLNDFTQ
jgi:DNA-binding transcriptional ArsR family regulator